MTAAMLYLSLHMSAGLAFLSALAVVTAMVRIVRVPPSADAEGAHASNVRRLVLFFIALYLAGSTLREYGVLTFGMTIWGHDALRIAVSSRALQVVGAIGFIGASSFYECGNRLWIGAAIVALTVGFLL